MPSTPTCSVATAGWTEAERLAELHSLGLESDGGGARYDDPTRIAALVCGTPIALVSLVEEDRQ